MANRAAGRRRVATPPSTSEQSELASPSEREPVTTPDFGSVIRPSVRSAAADDAR